MASAFRWAPLLGRLNGLVGVCGPDGSMLAVTGQLWSRTPPSARTRQIQGLVHETQEEALAEILGQVATGARPSTQVMVVLRHQSDRWLIAEISPLPNGEALVVLLPSDDLTELDSVGEGEVGADDDRERQIPLSNDASAEGVDHVDLEVVDDEDTVQDDIATPLFATERQAAGAAYELELQGPDPGRDADEAATAEPEALPALPPHPVLGPSETPKPIDAKLVIVAPMALRFTAARLQRAFDMATTKTTVWFDDDFDRKAKRLGDKSRVVFLGSSRYADFLRRVVEPRFKELGARWGLLPRKALVWVERNPDILRPQAQLACDALLRSVAKEEEYNQIRSNVRIDAATPGSRLCAKFLLDESPHRDHVDELLLHLALGTFLRDAWNEFLGDALVD